VSEPIHLTDASFEEEVVKSDLPVLIDFWAIWCGPCKMIASSMEQLAAEYNGKVKVCKMDVDEHPNTPARFGIRSIPTVLFFKDGEVIDQVIGAVPKSVLESKLIALI
jgi:thioredoxin 1